MEMRTWLFAATALVLQTVFFSVKTTTADDLKQVCPDSQTCSGCSYQARPSLAEPFNCNIHVKSYSAYDSCDHSDHSPCDPDASLPGFVTLNGRAVWSASWPPKTTPSRRGVNIIIVDPNHCTATGMRQFDTFHTADKARELYEYLGLIRQGAVVVGVTGDEPMRHLRPALNRLQALGVDVSDVRQRGSFTFVLQIGYPEKNVFSKVTVANERSAEIRVTLTGNTQENLTIKVTAPPEIVDDYYWD